MRILKSVIAVTFLVSAVFLPGSGIDVDVNAYVGWAGAEPVNSTYIGPMPIKPADIDATRSPRFSFYPSFELDSQDNPCIAWVDYSMGQSNVFFIRWDGTNWLTVDGTIYDPATGNSNVSNSILVSTLPSLSLDSSDNPHISWAELNPLSNTADIFYVSWNGSSWVCIDGSVYNPLTGNANVSTSATASTLPVVVTDSNDNPHLVWVEYTPTNADIYYMSWNGSSWICADGSIYNPLAPPPNPANVSINAFTSSMPSFVLDSADVPHIIWAEADPISSLSNIYYVRWSGSSWVVDDGVLYNPILDNANISQQAGTNALMYPFIATDSNNNPHVTWSMSDGTASRILYMHWDGAQWTAVDGSPYAPPAYNNINVSQNNYPYDDYWASIEIDSDDNPHLAWYDYHFQNGFGDIMYVNWSGTEWLTADGAVFDPVTKNGNLSQTTGLSAYPDLELDSDGYPHVGWFDSPDNIIFSTLGVNPFDPIGSYINMMMAIDANGWTSEIFYAHWLNDFDGDFSLSKSVDTNGDGLFTDHGETVTTGNILAFEIDFSFTPGLDPILDAHVYDTLPIGTRYLAGTAYPTTNLSYSVDFGSSWVAGEPPDGAMGGATMIRWSFPNGTTTPISETLEFSVVAESGRAMGFSNQAYFTHRYDEGQLMPSEIVSNTTVVCPECPELNSPDIDIVKTSSQMHYYVDDIFEFKAKVENRGYIEATDVILSDVFPREMEMIASRPKGSISGNSWSIPVGDLPPGQGRYVDFMFRLKDDVHVGQEPLTLTNKVTAECDELDSVSDTASIVVRNATGVTPLSIVTSWKGIDTRTFEGKTGEEVSLGLSVEGGSSPYQISIDWGDGNVEKLFDVPSNKTVTLTNTYTSSGEFDVIIKVVDQYGKTVFSGTTLYVE